MSTRFYKSLTGASLAVANTFTATQTFSGNPAIVAVTNPINVLHASGDANPSAQLGDGFVKFGAGGATALDLTITRTALPGSTGLLLESNAASHAAIAFGPQGGNTANNYFFYRTNSYNSNDEAVIIASDLTGANQYFFVAFSAGTGSVHPLLFGMDAAGAITESFRIKTDASFQFTTGPINISDALNIVLGSTTGTKIGTATTQKMAFFNSTPIVQPSAVGSATGYAAGATAATFHSDDTYTGNTGATAYTLNGIVANLKNLGLIAT